MPSFYPSEKEEKNDQKRIQTLSEEEISKRSWQEFWKTGIPSYLNLILIPFGWQIAAKRDSSGTVIAVSPVRTSNRKTKDSGINRTYHTLGKYLRKNSDSLYKESYDEDEIDGLDPSLFDIKEIDDFKLLQMNEPIPNNLEMIRGIDNSIDISDLR